MSLRTLLVGTAMVLAACFGSQTASAADYAVLLKAPANPFWQGMLTCPDSSDRY